MKTYNVKLWVRVLLASWIVIPALLIMAEEGGNVTVPVLVLIGGILVFAAFNHDYVLGDDALLARWLFPKEKIIKKVSYEDVFSVTGSKKMGIMILYLGLNPALVRKEFYSGTDDILPIPPYIRNRADFISRLLQKNPSIKTDSLTSDYLKKNAS